MYRFLILLLPLIPYTAFADGDRRESYNSGWRLNADNDLLAAQNTDRDYTGGLAITLSGRRAQEYPVSIDSWRDGIDGLVSFQQLYREAEFQSYHSQQFGMTLFTPDDIENEQPVRDDRPYASLFFMSNSEFTVVPAMDRAYVSRLTIGLLGLDLAEDVQKFLHGITDSDVPNGWQYQISSGGEPTAMLTYSVQEKLVGSEAHQLKLEYEGNIGFITDVNVGFSWRWGRINSPWWAYNPYQSKYVQQSMPVFSSRAGSGGDEFYLWAGGRLNIRLYNALLQGQFRHSEVTISSDDLQRLVAEYWLGVTREFSGRYFASLFIRGMSDEFKGPKSRSSAWVGLVFTRAY